MNSPKEGEIPIGSLLRARAGAVMSLLDSTTDRFFGAVRFLTIVPVRSWRGEEERFGAAAFPAVGCAIGVSIAAADVLLGILPFELRNVGVVA
ncbi:MAG: hypothetical protein ACREQY_08915, partial [Candidatus Binatia bacterium]